MYFIAFRVYLLRKTCKNPGRNKDSGNKDLGRNRGRRTEYTPLVWQFGTCPENLARADQCPDRPIGSQFRYADETYQVGQ